MTLTEAAFLFLDSVCAPLPKGSNYSLRPYYREDTPRSRRLYQPDVSSPVHPSRPADSTVARKDRSHHHQSSSVMNEQLSRSNSVSVTSFTVRTVCRRPRSWECSACRL